MTTPTPSSSSTDMRTLTVPQAIDELVAHGASRSSASIIVYRAADRREPVTHGAGTFRVERSPTHVDAGDPEIDGDSIGDPTI